VSLSGRVQPLLFDSTGLSCGIDPTTGEQVQAIPGCDVEVIVGHGGISVAEPLSGTYTLEVSALAEEVFTVDVELVDVDGTQRVRAAGMYHGTPMSLTVELDPLSSPVLTLILGVEPPVNVRAENVAGMTRLVWVASPDPAVASYNVYARADDQPKFTLLGTMAETAFDTGHPWNVAGSNPAWHYFVVSAADDGTESFFTETVENRHRLVARFSLEVIDGGEPTDPDTLGDAPVTVAFSDDSSGEVTAWAWDFDGDGQIDSTEQNPSWAYEEPGHYTVTLTVGGPEGTDTTVRAEAVVVGPLPEPAVRGDFDGDGLVSLDDYAAFPDRLNGPFVDPTLAGWHVFDLDFDYDVDLRDFAIWQALFDPEP